MSQSQAVRSKNVLSIVFIEKISNKNSLESFVFPPQPLLTDFFIYLLNNITFESHQHRKKQNKNKTIFTSMDYNKKFMFSAAVCGFHFYRRAWDQQKVKNLNVFITRTTYSTILQ